MSYQLRIVTYQPHEDEVWDEIQQSLLLKVKNKPGGIPLEQLFRDSVPPFHWKPSTIAWFFRQALEDLIQNEYIRVSNNMAYLTDKTWA